jgi:Leucine-rich repeat (LRR) protein
MIERIIFPDATFRAELQKMGFTLNLEETDIDMYNPDNKLIFEKVLEINISGTGVTSLAGISKFSRLRRLDCSNNKLSALDLTLCFELEYLNCSNNNLRSLNVGHCADLSYLDCSQNRLNMLDVYKLDYLNTLKCEGNNLIELAISQSSSLSQLNCCNNKLSSLDASSMRLGKDALLLCGGQKGDGKITLFINPSQKENWESTSAADSLNAGVVVTYK